MYINDVLKKDEIRSIAIQDLKQFGVKYRSKKARQYVQETKTRKVFRVALHLLPMETVTLPSGQQLVVPKIVNDLCSFIITKIDTEGLFRKGGSKSRQNEIRLSLDAGCYLGEEHHEVDVASVLKTFFRELPEPLIPFSFHELFLRCMLLSEHQIEAVLLSCLLIPMEHLNTLAYFMQFLFRVSEYSPFNKMDAYNLAVVMGPSLLPAEEKLPHNPTQRLTKTCELFKLLIENAANIGVLTESIIERIAITSSMSSLNVDDEANVKKKKKRRSGSLTRMLNGLKKIVSSKTEEVVQEFPPDLLLTPCITRSAKKRKIESAGISNKKRAIKKPTPETCEKTKEKKVLWSKSKAKVEEGSSKTAIQRRWSAVSSVAAFRRKKTRNSCAASLTHQKPKILEKDPQIDNRINDLSEELTKHKEPETENYVRISKVEYEEIKNRVSAIERRISIELENAEPEASATCDDGVKDVEMAYEQTLVQTEPLSPTTDQLAKRLSRELKIRRSNEPKVFRSPSARKIGSLRRRSRERDQVRLNRNQSWCVTSSASKSALRRGRPNTVQTGLPQPTTAEEPPKTRSNSFHGNNSPSVVANSMTSNSSTVSWKSAQGFFNATPMSNPGVTENCRASLAKLRSQNAGMVLAKAKLFDNLVDSECSSNKSGESNCVSSQTRSTKIGAPRVLDKNSRIQSLKMEERRKKAISPRKRNCNKSPQIRMQRISVKAPPPQEYNMDRTILRDCNRRGSEPTTSPKCVTPRNAPQIKRTLNPKSPRRICRTPVSEAKQTPLKVIATTRNTHHY
ncbi:PREDICTED: serine/arginine repetitive matrix protein 1-like isoform X2 [Nicrophorus vespilloides]|uniref:Serine/arginine repetitive matrix protein 1-like isoform X2 n=1 Tax=Nicrophorus vespilloides TaxID=110193 RepID=A0ABM1MSD8_NICVS|nr:PREDICTED: serine/arginine repetitive matrix protein 1-like isoform X2 [Nicrophorus vespilloides]